MAYFSNGSEGMCLDEQCAECRHGYKPCPIYAIQLEFNYKAANDELATEILNKLINNDGTCHIFEAFKKELELSDGEKAQQDLFT